MKTGDRTFSLRFAFASCGSAALGFSALALGACASGGALSEPGSPPSSPETPTAPQEQEGASAVPVQPAEPVETEAKAEPKLGPTPQERVAQACEENCVRMDQACAASAKVCRASCDDYVEQANECPVEIYEALKCQQQAEDFMLCSNVSPEECASKVLAMKDCRSGAAEPRTWGEEEAETSAPDSTPAGWTRLPHESQGFSLLFPKGASWSPVNGIEEASTKRDEVLYRARIVSLGGKKLSDRLILRTVVQEVSTECESKLRIFGRYDSHGTEHIRFKTPCKGQEDYHGALYIKGDRAVIVSLYREGHFSEAPEQWDAVFFGYQEP